MVTQKDEWLSCRILEETRMALSLPFLVKCVDTLPLRLDHVILTMNGDVNRMGKKP